MEAFRRNDHSAILACLTADVEWIVPGVFHVHGLDAFQREIVGDGALPCPEITVNRTVEAPNVVVAEGIVRAKRVDGTQIILAMCDVFDMRDGRIRRLTSYLMPTT